MVIEQGDSSFMQLMAMADSTKDVSDQDEKLFEEIFLGLDFDGMDAGDDEVFSGQLEPSIQEADSQLIAPSPSDLPLPGLFGVSNDSQPIEAGNNPSENDSLLFEDVSIDSTPRNLASLDDSLTESNLTNQPSQVSQFVNKREELNYNEIFLQEKQFVQNADNDTLKHPYANQYEEDGSSSEDFRINFREMIEKTPTIIKKPPSADSQKEYPLLADTILADTINDLQSDALREKENQHNLLNKISLKETSNEPLERLDINQLWANQQSSKKFALKDSGFKAQPALINQSIATKPPPFFTLDKNGYKANLHVNQGDMGHIVAKIEVDKLQTNVTLITDNQDTKQLMQSQLSQLKTSFDNANMNTLNAQVEQQFSFAKQSQNQFLEQGFDDENALNGSASADLGEKVRVNGVNLLLDTYV